MRLNKKSISKIMLVDLLRRKQISLEKFLTEHGIVTYDRLVSRCLSIGVIPPSESQFNISMGSPIMHEFSSPTEGIVVLNPLSSVEEETTTVKEELVFGVSELILASQTKKKRKKS